MSPLQPLDSTPDLVDRVYRHILEAISSGQLAPGARLTQEELAASLGVSRQPVHQALRQLKKDGFLTDAGRRGLMVSPLDGRGLARLYEVRSVLDGLAARLAAQAGTRLDPALIEAGRQSVKKSLLEAIRADLRFHQAIYEASGNPLIAESAHHYWQHISRAMGAVLGPRGLGPPVWEEHEQILRAINDRDAARAESLARRHCEEAGRVLSSQLQDSTEEKAHEAHDRAARAV